MQSENLPYCEKVGLNGSGGSRLILQGGTHRKNINNKFKLGKYLPDKYCAY